MTYQSNVSPERLQTLPYQPQQPFKNALGLPIGTVIDDGFPGAWNMPAPLAGQGRFAPTFQSTRYGVGGLESQPGQNGIDPPPPPPQGASTTLPSSPEEKPKSELNLLLEHLLRMEERQNDPEVMKRKTDEALRLMNAIGDKQMELGWKSNLIGFALKDLPRMMTEPARRRNRYLDDIVLNTPGIYRQGSQALTGQGIPNYAMGI